MLLDLCSSFIVFFCTKGPAELGLCEHVPARVGLTLLLLFSGSLSVTRLTGKTAWLLMR